MLSAVARWNAVRTANAFEPLAPLPRLPSGKVQRVPAAVASSGVALHGPAGLAAWNHAACTCASEYPELVSTLFRIVKPFAVGSSHTFIVPPPVAPLMILNVV